MKYTLIAAILFVSGCSLYGETCGRQLGDVTRDGVLGADDAALILDYSLGLTAFDECQAFLADYNRDGVVDSTDAARVFDASF